MAEWKLESGPKIPDSSFQIAIRTGLMPTFFRWKGYLLGLPQRLPSIDAGFQFVTPKIIQL